MSMELYNWGKSVAQPSVIMTYYGRRVTSIEWNASCRCDVGGHSLLVDAIFEIVYTTKIHSVISYCFKVSPYISTYTRNVQSVYTCVNHD